MSETENDMETTKKVMNSSGKSQILVWFPCVFMVHLERYASRIGVKETMQDTTVFTILHVFTNNYKYRVVQNGGNYSYL